MPFKNYNQKLAYARELYSKYRTKIIEKVRERKDKTKKWLEDYKKTLKCSKCGEAHPATLDFHHKLDNSKVAGVAYFVANGYSIKTIEKELKNCEVLCANCHRKLHYKTAIFKRQ
jgi:tRNA G26 N,N-dimethylase Trm1